MIFVLGGTSETGPVARGLAEAGYRILVSTLTDLPLDVGVHPNLERRCGPLDREGMVELMRERKITAVVDVSHPYATLARISAREAAREINLPYVSWVRPRSSLDEAFVHFSADHEHAAEVACSFGTAVLLTTGSRNLVPYVAEASRKGVLLAARVLPAADSVRACMDAGIPEDRVVTGRGPFSLDENLAVIRRFRIGVLVTKDSGVAGGVPDKIEAARLSGCHVVVVERPRESLDPTFSSVEELVQAVAGLVQRGG